MYNWKAIYSFRGFSNYMKNYYIQNYKKNVWLKIAISAKTREGIHNLELIQQHNFFHKFIIYHSLKT